PPAAVPTAQLAARAHPRIYLTPARLARAAARDTASDPAAVRYYSSTLGIGYFLNALNQNPDPTSAGFASLVDNPEGYLPALGLCYQLKRTSDPTTAGRCSGAARSMLIKLAHDYDTGVRSFARDSGYDIRFGLRNLVLGYDWLYDLLSADDR